MNTMNTNNDTMTVEMKHAGLLASWLGCEADDVTEARSDCYGLNVYNTPDGEFAVGTDDECLDALTCYVENNAWAFNADFILSCCGLPSELAEAIQAFQSKECEGANDAIVALIKKTCGLQHFIDKAVQADGSGHFLASYDGDEVDLGGNVYAYRIG